MRVLARPHGLRLIAFTGLAALAAWRYAGVEAGPPTARVLILVAIAVLAAALTPVVGGAGPRIAVLIVLLGAALLAAGVPLGLGRPDRWGTLIRRLHGGLTEIGNTQWPYSGSDRWTRIDLMLVIACGPLAAAALAFWPVRREARLALARARARGGAALVVLLTVYVLGLLDSNGGSVPVEGLVLLALIAAWLWPAGLGRRRAVAATGWLATAGALAAVLAGPLASGQAWLGYRDWNLLGTSQPRIAFAWDQTYGPIPWSRSERTMFTVSTSHSGLWKTTTLDRFDGTRFARSGVAPPGAQDLPLPLNDRWYRFARFTIAGLRSSLLPAEQGVTSGVRTGLRVSYQGDGTVTTGSSALPSGATYTVLSYVPDPAVADLRAAPRVLPAGYRRYTSFELPEGQGTATVTARDRDQILASPYAPMYRLARHLARGRRTAYDVARAVEQYLQTNEAYGERVPVRRYPLEAFLFTDHLGYCQQFSGAMALMLRMDGIPARVAAGFLPGTYDSATREWVVRAVDAHSWVEVYFAGIGWVRFNPTPPRAQSAPRQSLFASQRGTAVTQLEAIAATVGGLPHPAGTHAARRRRKSDIARVAALAGGLIALLVVTARWVGGALRLRRSLRGDEELATAELVRGLRRLGYAIPATVTLSRIEAIVRLHGGPEAAQYVRRLRDRRYRSGPGTPATLADRRRLRRGVTRRLGFDTRLRGLWALPPGTMAWRVRPGQPGGP